MISDADLFWYRAKYLANYDGDTVDVLVDLGFRIAVAMKIRLLGINCPELRQPTFAAGAAARDFLRALVCAGTELRVKSLRDTTDKYGGRWLGELWRRDEAGQWTNLNQLMVEAGHAVVYKP